MNLDHIIDGNEVLDLTTDIMSAYVMRNKVSVDQMCETIEQVYNAVYAISRTNKPLSYKELLNGGEVSIQD